MAQSNAPTGHRGDRQILIDLLARELATELTCMLRDKQHHFVAEQLHTERASAQFNEHSRQKMEHAFLLAERITQLGGQPDLNPKHIGARSHVEYVTCDTVKGMIQANLAAERIVIESYLQTIDFTGTDDPTTRRLLEEILAESELYVENLENLLSRVE